MYIVRRVVLTEYVYKKSEYLQNQTKNVGLQKVHISVMEFELSESFPFSRKLKNGNHQEKCINDNYNTLKFMPKMLKQRKLTANKYI